MNSTKRKKSDENVKSLFTLNLMTLSAKSAGDLMRRQIHTLSQVEKIERPNSLST